MIEERNGTAYDKVTALQLDLAALADAASGRAAFDRRVLLLTERHERKGQLVRRLAAAGLVAPR